MPVVSEHGERACNRNRPKIGPSTGWQVDQVKLHHATGQVRHQHAHTSGISYWQLLWSSADATEMKSVGLSVLLSGGGLYCAASAASVACSA